MPDAATIKVAIMRTGGTDVQSVSAGPPEQEKGPANRGPF